MRTFTNIGAWMAVLLCLLCAPCGAEVVDRSIAVVNGHMITWSDLDEQMRFEALQNGRALKELTAADRQQAFDRLVQNWIVRDQMQGTPPASESDVAAQIGELRKSLQLEDDARWRATLDSYGISEDELRRLVANQHEILSFLEFRVRPLVRVSREEIEQYYNETLVPQIEAQGQKPDPVAQLRTQIRQLLREQKVSQELEKWLHSVRAQAQVQVLWDGVQWQNE
jgi:peptidyl-prolyl cis-trans isomerase SurA